MRLSVGFAIALLAAVVPALVRAQGSAQWEQHVHYDMAVTLLADRHQLRGTQRLTYTNNSPDTLSQVFYHLYFNAFQPQSMMAERNRHLPDPDGRVVPRIFELDETEIGYHEVLSLTQDGVPVAFRTTDTVLRVDLAEPILPGETTVFAMRFRSQVPLQTRRSGRDNREGIDYSMTQWYPKLAMYDERGWHADPYIGREFYAPFGTFDVRLTLPSDYVVASTGVLQNAADVGHGYSGMGAGPAIDADSLTWHFNAEQVHDFAWSADPDYLHDVVQDAMGVTYHLLYQPAVAERWQYMTNWLPAIVQFFSREYGMYPYPQMTVAQGGDGGMEYPMITLVTGRRSPGSLFGVTAHEVAHMWFYGVLGSNEADYAWMDEGFASYADTEARQLVYDVENPSHRGSFLNVLRLHDLGLYEPINTPSDWFTTNTAYGTAAYSAGDMLITMMGYVIGEEQRLEWLREYYERFKFRHPNPYDVEKVAEDVSGLRLDWYFQQFGYTAHELDYAVEDIDSERASDGYRTKIVLEREDEIVMPVDVKLTLADGSTQWVNVPLVVMQGHKPVPADWIVAEPWPWTSPRYTLEVRTDQPVKGAEIDPEGLTPDRNRLNNTASFPLETRFLRPPRQDWFDYSVGWRPLVQYAHDFGFGGGVRAEGTYLFGDHQLGAMVKLWPQVLASSGDEPSLPGAVRDSDRSWFDGIDFQLTYATDASTFGPRARAAFSTAKHLGFLESEVRVNKPLTGPLADFSRTFDVALVHQLNPTDRAFARFEKTLAIPVVCEGGPLDDCAPYQPLATDVVAFRRTHLLSARARFAVEDDSDYLRLTGEVGGSLRGGAHDALGLSEPSATHILAEAGKALPIGPLTARADAAVGVGAADLALHKRFRLGAASFENRWRSDAFRSVAAAFAHPLADAHLAAFSATGPVAYLLSNDADEVWAADPLAPVGRTPLGRVMLAGRVTITTGQIARHALLRPLRLHLFSGWGTVDNTDTSRLFTRSSPTDAGGLADAGFGLSYDVGSLRPLRRWTAQSDVLSGLNVVAKLPVWVSDPDLIEVDEDPVAFRWLVGIQIDR